VSIFGFRKTQLVSAEDALPGRTTPMPVPASHEVLHNPLQGPYPEGTETAEFARLYTAPGVDHVGSGAPANVDMLGVLVDWVEKGQAPDNLEVVEQKVEAPSFAVERALPLCRWPAWPHYKGGDVKSAASYACAP